MRVLIAAGGTAGHVVPALAVAGELLADGDEVHFAGGARAEKELVPAAGYPFHTIPAEGISRTNAIKAARALARAVGGLLKAVRLLRRLRPDVVMGGGGYVAGPVGLAAVMTRTPLVLTEADSHLGLANRALARFAHRVCLAFPIPGRAGGRYLVTGRPIAAPGADRAAARERFGIPADVTCVLVFGGSLGARSINRAALEAFADAPFWVLHAAGRRDFPGLVAPGEHYLLHEYIEPFGDALAAADLVVARSGSSIFEIAAYGLPAVLVPYPHASADHQTANARWMEQAGAAVVVADAALDGPRLAREVGAILADPSRLQAMARASRGLARPAAARDVANEIHAAARR